MRRSILFLALLAGALPARAEPPVRLEKAVESWLGERDHWAFTQRAVESYDGRDHVRLERYDPSKPGNARWELLSIDGGSPSADQRAAWEKKKFRKTHRKFDSPIGDFFDFDHAIVAADTPHAVRYVVPLRNDRNWLFPTDKVDVTVTVSKQTGGLEHLTARVREPFKVLLGVARITGGALDLTFDTSTGEPTSTATQPTGVARASVSRLGEHVEFTWSDFKRVMPAPDVATD